MKKELQRTEDGLAFEDGLLALGDGRELAWRWWGEPAARPVLFMQGMPGSRLSRPLDPTILTEVGVRYLMADRPGYGGSSRRPGHGIADIADDYVSLLDHHRLSRVPVIGVSGGGPHALAFAARYPDRVTAVTIVVGAAPMHPDEAAGLIGLNAKAYIAKQKSWQDVFQLLSDARGSMLTTEGRAEVFKGAPADDRAMLVDKRFQQLQQTALAEALRTGAEGWADESFALRGDFDFDPADVQASVTWWHGDNDMNAPLSAARRVVKRLPHARLRISRGDGHLALIKHLREILEELLSRDSTDDLISRR